jgi:hypothetical protein
VALAAAALVRSRPAIALGCAAAAVVNALAALSIMLTVRM